MSWNESFWPKYVFLFIVAILARWAITAGPYSGMSTPPTYGDFEAQRHWMEITYNLPIEQWYVNGTNNDLLYWGLDYPPLTAYHSWLMGVLSNWCNSDWVKLRTSRAIETYEHKLFMRYSVIFGDILVFFPAVLLILRRNFGGKNEYAYLASYLLYPGLILVDHGHFQYNSISLGFFLLSVGLLFENYYKLSSVFFVFALNYKQMELYHSLPIFFYLLAFCNKQNTIVGRCSKLFEISATVLATFLIIWLPFLSDTKLTLQVLRRIFPLNRGLFEDKVANFWCATSVIIKWKLWFSSGAMVKLCSISTLLVAFPSCLLLFLRPNVFQFKSALLISSLAFFLFSYQVHEKSILLVAIPALLLLREDTVTAANLLLTSVASLYPLCVKDGIHISFYGYFAAYYIFFWDFCGFLDVFPSKNGKEYRRLNHGALLVHLNQIFCLILCFFSEFGPVPLGLPHLYPLLNSMYCCAVFCITLFYVYYRQITLFYWGDYGGTVKKIQ